METANGLQQERTDLHFGVRGNHLASADLLMKLADLGAYRAEIQAIARQHGAMDLLVFGSTASNTAGPASDVDLLVSMEQGRSLLDLIAIKQDLEELLDREVDVVTRAGLREDVLAEVTRTAKPL